jgi:hypothetical protein
MGVAGEFTEHVGPWWDRDAGGSQEPVSTQAPIAHQFIGWFDLDPILQTERLSHHHQQFVLRNPVGRDLIQPRQPRPFEEEPADDERHLIGRDARIDRVREPFDVSSLPQEPFD